MNTCTRRTHNHVQVQKHKHYVCNANAKCMLHANLNSGSHKIDHPNISIIITIQLQYNLSIKDTLNVGHNSNEDTVCSPNHIELCTNLPLN